MEQQITAAQALTIINEYGGYGSVRVYGIIEGGECDGQIVAIKSEYHLGRYNYSRIYARTNNGTVPVRQA